MSMNHVVFGLCCLALGGAGVLAGAELRLPGNNRGYEPEQPIAFSHRLHAGELAMHCEYCHFGARRSRHAGVPPATLCMNCHKTVTATLDVRTQERAAAELEQRAERRILSPELAKLYDALALDEQGAPLPGVEPRPIEWVRVHNLPDFVYFDHRPHVARRIACETCHGPVGTMDRMRQESSLSMGWCLDCHRANEFGRTGRREPDAGRVANHVSTNCVTCHL